MKWITIIVIVVLFGAAMSSGDPLKEAAFRNSIPAQLAKYQARAATD